MKRSLTILSLVLFSFIFIGGTASADDGVFLSSDANPTFGTAISTALDCSMPSTQAKTTAKIEKWSESRMTRYNKSWDRKLRDLVYRNYRHQYTRTEINDMSETELANLLRSNPPWLIRFTTCQDVARDQLALHRNPQILLKIGASSFQLQTHFGLCC